MVAEGGHITRNILGSPPSKSGLSGKPAHSAVRPVPGCFGADPLLVELEALMHALNLDSDRRIETLAVRARKRVSIRDAFEEKPRNLCVLSDHLVLKKSKTFAGNTISR